MKIQVIKPYVELVTPESHLKDAEKIIEKAGRTCYKSEDKITDDSAEKFVERIIRSGHESVIEHISATIKVVGDRSMSHQLVRHRLAAYSQESQRYCNYGNKGYAVVCPPSISNFVGEFDIDLDTDLNDGKDLLITKDGNKLNINTKERVWLYTIVLSMQAYQSLLSKGVPAEDARSVLPNAMKTEVVTTFNLRQWRHVFKHRALNKRAQWQIRGLMLDALNLLSSLMPTIFKDLE